MATYQRCTRLAGCLTVLLTIGVLPQVAHASYIINLSQFGPDVVATGSGTVNTTALTAGNSGSSGAMILPLLGEIGLGPGGSNVEFFTGISGPTSFGTGHGQGASSASGDLVFVYGQVFYGIVLPLGYVSGAPLSSSATFANSTFSSIGITPGVYRWTWGSGPSADSVTLNANAASPAPEPQSLSLLAISVAIMMILPRRKRASSAR